MKNTITNSFKAALWSIALVFGMMACTQMEDLDPNNMNVELSSFMDGSNPFARMSGEPSVEPIFWNQRNGGNATCDDAASQFDGVDGFELSSGRINYVDGAFEGTWPEGLEVQVIDGKVYWEYIAPEGFCLENMSVIVKGGPAANIYNYESGIYHDGGLVAPVNAGNGKGKKAAAPIPAGLSNLTFCFNLTDAPDAPVAGDNQSVPCIDDLEEPLVATATAPAGVDVVWYTQEIGGTPITTPLPSLSTLGSITYWAEAVRFNGCVSLERVPVTLTIGDDCGDDGGSGDPDPNTCGNDTAFAGEVLLTSKDNDKGSWYYLMNYSGNSVTNTLFAGQTNNAGTVTLSPNNEDSGKVDVIVTLASGYQLQSGDNYYIHGYTSFPDNRPIGGQQGTAVTYKKGTASQSTFTITVDRKAATIFAVHVNVAKICP